MRKQYFKPKSRIFTVEIGNALLQGTATVDGTPPITNSDNNPGEGGGGWDDEEEEARYNDFYFD